MNEKGGDTQPRQRGWSFRELPHHKGLLPPEVNNHGGRQRLSSLPGPKRFSDYFSETEYLAKVNPAALNYWATQPSRYSSESSDLSRFLMQLDNPQVSTSGDCGVK